MRTTLDLPDPLFWKVKAHAARRGIKMKDLLATYIENGLRGSNQVQSPVVRSLLPVSRRTTGMTIPATTNSEIAEIFDSEDASHAGY